MKHHVAGFINKKRDDVPEEWGSSRLNTVATALYYEGHRSKYEVRTLWWWAPKPSKPKCSILVLEIKIEAAVIKTQTMDKHLDVIFPPLD
jgi:hypothetical protein